MIYRSAGGPPAELSGRDIRAITLAFFLVFVVVLGIGCSAKYSIKSIQSKSVLQWPLQPAPPKITYVEAFRGFARNAGSHSVIHVITGDMQKDNDLFLLPVSIAKGQDGRIAVADIGNSCVHLFIPAKDFYKRICGQGREVMKTPVNVIFDDDLRMFVSDSSGKIFAFGSNASFLFSITSSGTVPLQRPTGLAYSSSKKLLYVVDTLQNQVNAFDRDGKFLFSFGKRGEKEGEFNFPTHIFCSASGALYVTDSLNFRIQIFDSSGAFLGLFGSHGDSSGDLAMPKGVVADQDGIIYVVDSLFDNVQLFDSKGSFLLTLGRRGTELGEFWLPSGAFVDHDMLYVCDTYNHRVQVFRITENYMQRKADVPSATAGKMPAVQNE